LLLAVRFTHSPPVYAPLLSGGSSYRRTKQAPSTHTWTKTKAWSSLFYKHYRQFCCF